MNQMKLAVSSHSELFGGKRLEKLQISQNWLFPDLKVTLTKIPFELENQMFSFFTLFDKLEI